MLCRNQNKTSHNFLFNCPHLQAQANGYEGPVLGPKESTKNVREFTDEQLRASEGIISAQAGTNKVASQKGMAFGKVLKNLENWKELKFYYVEIKLSSELLCSKKCVFRQLDDISI